MRKFLTSWLCHGILDWPPWLIDRPWDPRLLLQLSLWLHEQDSMDGCSGSGSGHSAVAECSRGPCSVGTERSASWPFSCHRCRVGPSVIAAFFISLLCMTQGRRSFLLPWPLQSFRSRERREGRAGSTLIWSRSHQAVLGGVSCRGSAAAGPATALGPLAVPRHAAPHSLCSCARQAPGPRLEPQDNEAWASLPCCRHAYLEA